MKLVGCCLVLCSDAYHFSIRVPGTDEVRLKESG
jgi:hypothetical protein